MLATLRMKEEGYQSHVENQTDGGATEDPAGDVVVDSHG